MKLYSYYRSSAAFRVRIAMHLKQLSFDYQAVNLADSEQRSDDYLALNASGLVPSLELDDGRVLTQSGAIMSWLESVYPTPQLIPSDAYAAAKLRGLCESVACDIHPINNLRVLRYLSSEFGVDAEKTKTWYQHWIKEGFQALELQLSLDANQVSNGSYALGGEMPSLLDVYIVPQVYNALRFDLDMSHFEKLQAVFDFCVEHPAFMAAHPDNQIDNPDNQIDNPENTKN